LCEQRIDCVVISSHCSGQTRRHGAQSDAPTTFKGHTTTALGDLTHRAA
jgi:hypothetical protein